MKHLSDLHKEKLRQAKLKNPVRFDINNCRTLCAKCHYQITFGKLMPKSIQGWGHNLLKRGDLHF